MSDIEDGIELTESQAKARRQRSIAIGICLALFVIIVYVGTWAKLGPELFVRPM
ncbi:MAG: hypothetical protein AAF940_08430 [Pseudomonadota bacterium]